jgi:3'(2'), 5'-bisphosphate nucleotidase
MMQEAELKTILKLKLIEDIAIGAGAEILDVYHGDADFEVELKADDSPITQADQRAHDYIIAALTALDPTIPILSEESTAIDFSVRQKWSVYWLVDPLDGTREFISRNGEFSVNIALIKDGEPILGVIHVPVLGITYSGQQGIGSSKRRGSGQAEAIKSVAVGSPIRVVASRHHRGLEVDTLIDYIKSHHGEPDVVSMGSSLKMCLLAEGAADFYPRLGPTSEWDTGAAHAILIAAGGQLVDLQFRPLRYNQKAELLNPSFLGLGDTAFDWRSLVGAALDKPLSR